jgi:hypothetical protein
MQISSEVGESLRTERQYKREQRTAHSQRGDNNSEVLNRPQERKWSPHSMRVPRLQPVHRAVQREQKQIPFSYLKENKCDSVIVIENGQNDNEED